MELWTELVTRPWSTRALDTYHECVNGPGSDQEDET
jgi:hypothetical protein